MKSPKHRKSSYQVWSIPNRKERRLQPRPNISASHEALLNQAMGELKEGDQLNNRFEILERIGKGGMSIVYRALDIYRDQLIALKFISPSLLQEPDAVRKFIQEVKIASHLTHPGIVKVFDVHHSQGIYFLEMELLEGKTLRDWMKQSRETKETLSMNRVHSLIQSICTPLKYAHATTIHRDIKPENIALLPSEQIKIMDFGLAQVIRTPHSSLFRQSVNEFSAGTPYYMAPEVLTPDGPVDERADQYSVAVIAFELLTGRFPLGVSAMLSEKRPDLPLRFTEVIERALNYHPEQRFDTINDFAIALERSIQPEGWIASTRRRWKISPTFFKAAMIILVCGAITWLATSIVRERLFQRTEQIFLLLEEARGSQSAMDQLRENIRALDMEKEIMRRRMEVEGAVIQGELTPSTAWLQASNQWNSINAAYQWIQPRLNADGHWNSMSALLQAARSAIDAGSFQQAKSLFDQLDWEREKSTNRVGLIKNVYMVRDSILRLKSTSHPNIITDLKREPSLSFLQSNDWEAGLKLLEDQQTGLRTSVEETYKNQSEQLEQAEEKWINLFGESIGPPDLSFLVDVHNMKERADAMFQVEDFTAALDLLQLTTQTYQRWTKEVRDQRNQSQETWTQAKHRIEALDMRFIKVNHVYWSIWETRIMDFARWLSDNAEIAQLVLNQLDFSSEQIGPTYPVTGLDRRTASGISIWFGYQMKEFDRPISSLPEEKDWDQLWLSENLEGEYQFGITPVEDPARLLIYKDYYLDNLIDPQNYLKPAGSRRASRNGLFDLEGNAWEWSSSDLILDRSESNNQEPFKWKLHGGGFFGQHRFNEFEPPRENAVFITRPQAIGFRIIITPNSKLLNQE